MSRPKSAETLLPLNHDELDFFRTAYIIGNALCSTSQYLRMGAVLIMRKPKGQVMVANGSDMLKKGVRMNARYYEPGLRETCVIDAPLVAMDTTRTGGIDIRGCNMYTPAIPTRESLQAMVDNGIVELITHADFNKEARRIDPEWNKRYMQALDFISISSLRHRSISGRVSTPDKLIITYFRGREYDV